MLDFLRRQRRLVGTKEGCKEGDCGACVVLVGELDGTDRVRYAPMTSCMMPLAEADGKHVVTIEGLDLGRMNRAQKEIVDAGASQCGFCTPGIVVSLMGHLMEEDAERAEIDGGTLKGSLAGDVERALSGHLCRCTGYRSLRAAASTTFEGLAANRGVEALVTAGELPASFLEIPARLRALRDASPDPSPIAGAAPSMPDSPGGPALGAEAPLGDIVAGGTDLYVQRGEELPLRDVTSLERLRARRPHWRGLRLEGGEIRIGALTRFEDLASDPRLRSKVPRISEFMDLIASWQIRTRSTIGGNLINASPIGDVTVLMLALGAVAVFEDFADIEASGLDPETTLPSRSVPLDELYIGYKTLDRRASEILAEVRVPDLGPGEIVDFEKVSKRRWLDIATVNSAARIRVRDGLIERARLAVGGVAPKPLFLEQTSAALAGGPLETSTLELALRLAQEEIAPISDVRGSADYKRLLVRNLIVAHWTKLSPKSLASLPQRLFGTTPSLEDEHAP